MRALYDLIAQRLRKLFEQLVLLLEAIRRLLVVLQVTLDFRVHRHGHLCSVLELLQSLELHVELLFVGIQILNERSHVTDSVGVECDSNDHPSDGKESL